MAICFNKITSFTPQIPEEPPHKQKFKTLAEKSFF